MYESSYTESYGGSILSNVDIKNEMKNGRLFIAPYEPLQLQPSGYNLTPTRLIYSTKKKKLLPVYEQDDEVYVMVERNDTVLVRTRETLIVPSQLAGAFYSKVKVVSQGFGHVSTTLDPYWEGQLLISLNNPTNRSLKFSIEKNVYGKTIYNSFVTVQFMTLRTPTQMHADNLPGRLDIFETTLERNISLLKWREVQRLWDLVEELRKYESKTIEKILIEKLDEEDCRKWEEIHKCIDEKSYEQMKNSFLEQKHKQYLRSIQEQVEKDAISCIDIVNCYTEKKQKCLPLSYKISHWMVRHLYEMAGILIGLLIVMIIWNPVESLPEKCLIVKMLNNAEAQSWLLGGVIVYILLPILKKIFEPLWNRIR